jgi:hypothetical protein
MRNPQLRWKKKQIKPGLIHDDDEEEEARRRLCPSAAM